MLSLGFKLTSVAVAVRAAIGGASFVAASYDSNYEMQLQTVGVGAPTVTSSEMLLPDYEGVYRPHPINQAAFAGGRTVRNDARWSRDITQSSAWSVQGSAIAAAADYLTNLLSVFDGVMQIVSTDGKTGDTRINTVKLLGSGTINIVAWSNSGGSTTKEIALTATPKIYTVAHTLTADSTSIRFYVSRGVTSTATAVTMTDMQSEDATGRIDLITPSLPHIATTTAAATKAFANENGNSVTDNVVTEGVGELIDKELITNGGDYDVATDGYIFLSTDGWIGDGTIVAGEFVTTTSDKQTITTIIGRKYRLNYSGTGSVDVGTADGLSDLLSAASGQASFIATGTSTFVKLNAGTMSYIRVHQRGAALQYAPARTSSGIYNRDLTNGAWNPTNITPLATDGADGVTDSGSELTATAANGTILQTVIAASGEHSMRPLVKRKTGSGTIEMTVDGGTTWYDITEEVDATGFTPVAYSQAAVTDPSYGFRIVTDTDAIYVDCVELSLDTTAAEIEYSPVIQTSGAAASIVRTVIRFDLANHNQTQGLWAVGGWIPGYDPNATSDKGILTVRAASASVLYDHNTSNHMASFDSTNLSVVDSVNWLAGEIVPLAVAYGSGLAVGVSGVFDVTGVSYDGAFLSESYIELGYSNPYPAQLQDIQFWDLPYDAAKAKGLELMSV